MARNTRCILYRDPTSAVVEQARAGFARAPLSERIEAIGGDFFSSVPVGADAYVVKHVVHNWGDEEAIELLRRGAAALRPGGLVLIVESILLPGNRRDGTPLCSISKMLVLCGAGRERSKPEFRTLLRRAGLKVGIDSRPRRHGALVGGCAGVTPLPGQRSQRARTPL